MATYALILPLLTILLVACPGKHSPSQGGQDGGGGLAQSSTPAQVREAIDRAFAMTTEADVRRNILTRFWAEWNDQGQLNPSMIFPKIQKGRIFRQGHPEDMITGSKGGIEDADRFTSPVIQALKQNEKIYLKNGSCPSRDNKHAEASVSSLNLSAKICFSVGKLTRIPPAGLLKEILALLIHEAVHMGGAQEQEAQLWQKQFTLYLENRFQQMNVEKPEDNMAARTTMENIKFCKWGLEAAKAINAAKPGDARMIMKVIEVINGLDNMPYFLDPLLLDHWVRPVSPWLVNNYSNSILALMVKIHDTFGLYSDKLYDMDVEPLYSKMSKEQIDKALSDMIADVWVITENFQAYAFAGYAQKSKCNLPASEPPVNNPFTPQFGLSQLRILPPQVCDTQQSKAP